MEDRYFALTWGRAKGYGFEGWVLVKLSLIFIFGSKLILAVY